MSLLRFQSILVIMAYGYEFAEGALDFPPLYTLQPNETSRRKQFGLWRDILRVNNLFIITKTSPIFRNDKIHRMLNTLFPMDIF